jgi:hypothetical protein
MHFCNCWERVLKIIFYTLRDSAIVLLLFIFVYTVIVIISTTL